MPLSFRSPWLLLGLLVLAGAVVVWKLAERRRMRYAVRYTNLEVLATVVSGRSRLRLVPAALFLLGITSLLVALARPEVERMLLKERATVILVVDTSRSMQAEDVEPTRLGAAQEAIRTFLDQAPDGLRVGLVVFAGETQVATPPTRDHELVRTAVDEIDSFLVFGGTAIGDALRTAVELGVRVTGEPPPTGEIAAGQLRQPTTLASPPQMTTAPGSPSTGPPPNVSFLRTTSGSSFVAEAQAVGCAEKSPVSILFLSDGAQTRGVLQPLEGAALAKRACFPVHTIALGTPTGVIARGSFGFGTGPGNEQLIPVPPDPDTLRAIAELTGGEFSEVRKAEVLKGAYENLGSRLGREPGTSEITFVLVALAAGLLLAAGVMSAIVAPRLP